MNILHIDEQTGWRGGEQQASYLIRGLVERGHRCFVAGKPGSEFLTRDHGAGDQRVHHRGVPVNANTTPAPARPNAVAETAVSATDCDW